MKIFTDFLRQIILFGVLFFAFSFSSFGAEETATLSFASTAQRTSFSTTQQIWQQNGITLTNDKSSSSSNVADYANPARFYKSSKITIEAPGNIKTIVFYCSGSSYATALKNSIKDDISIQNDKTVTISPGSKSSSYTIPSLSGGQVRMSNISVTYEVEQSCIDPTISFASTTITKTNGDDNFTNSLNKGGSNGAVTYSSSSTAVATVNTTSGEVTIKGVGTTTITATVAEDGTYCEGFAQYTLVVTGRIFNITWMNGDETHATTTYTEGETLTLPTSTPISCSDDYPNFVGWYTAQAGSTTTPSVILDGLAKITTTTKPSENSTYYAVFGNAVNEGVSTASLTKEEIISNFTHDKCVYETSETYLDTDDNIIWSSTGYADGNDRPWIQYKAEDNIYLQAETSRPIKKIVLTITSASNSSGGVAEITKHASYDTRASIKITDGTNEITTISGGNVENNILEIDLSTNTSNTIRILTINYSCRIWNVELFFSSTTSSSYISTCDAIQLVQLPIPSNLHVTNITHNGFVANWDAVENATEYQVEVNNTTITTVETSYVVTNLTPETEYTFTIKAIGDGVTYTDSEVAKSDVITTLPIPTYSATFHINATDKVVIDEILLGTVISDLDGVSTLLNTCNTDFLSFAGWTTDTETLGGYAKPEIVTTITDNVDLYPVFSNAYAQLVTDESQLQINDKIIIVATNYNYALSINQKASNRGQVEIGKIGNQIGLNDSIQIITLKEGLQENTFSFYVVGSNIGYLYAANSDNNYLRTKLSLDSVNKNTDWSISINNSIATLKAKGTNTNNWLRYNSTSKLFSCYIGGQKDVSIYEVVDATQWIVCHNSTLSIESGDTHNVVANTAVDNLIIKSNYDQAAQINVTAGSLTAQKVIVEKTIDASRYYFFSLPFDCDLNDVVAIDSNGDELQYADSPTTGDYVINYYDQDTAANNKGAMGSKAWVEITDKNATLNANQGYIIGYLVNEGIATIKFKSSGAQTISTPATTTLSIKDYTWYTPGDVATANGWNLIGMPYYQKPNNGSLSADINVYYATMPNDDGKTYTQTTFADADIAPFTSFFVQTEVAPTFTISEPQNAAPRLTDGRANHASQQKAVIAFADANGGKDQTTIINNQNTTADYEIGYDLVKWIGYAAIPQIYSIQGDDILAFNSLAIDNATVIPLGVYAHADGEYTFSIDAKSAGDLQGWELYDNEEGKTIRLANETLTVYLEKGKHEGRFELRLQQRVATDCDSAMSNMQTWVENGKLNIDNMPIDARVYIYDAVGRMLYADNEVSESFSYDLPGRGVYSIVVSSAVETIAFKTIY